MTLKRMRPEEIEGRSMEIIGEELARLGPLPPADCLPVVKRVIHATADFDYRQSLWFSPGAVAAGVAALKAGAWIVTDTNMARAGVNRGALRGPGAGWSALWRKKRSPGRQGSGGPPGPPSAWRPRRRWIPPGRP